MRIIKLEFENINSLKGLQSIDFTQPPLSNSGLFLIAGPTGSGKSTILDAITLALFNKIPRFNSPISVNQIVKLGSVVTHFENHAMSSITYESNGKQYNSTWSLSKNRNDNWRDYHMEIYELSDKNIIDLKKSEVPEYNEQLIGLKYEQFLKSILLSQGEFSQFLKADHNTRGALLEKLTGTEIYRKIGELAYSRWKSEKEALDNELSEINAIPVLTAEDVTAKESHLNSTQKEILELEKELKLTQEDIQIKTNLSDTSKQINKLKSSIDNHEFVMEEFKPFDYKLQKHNALSPLTSDLALVRSKNGDIFKAQQELGLTNNQFNQASKSLTDTIDTMSSLLKGPLTKDSFIAEMKALEKKYIELTTKGKSLVDDGKELRSRINQKLQFSLDLTDKMPPKEALIIIENKEIAYNKKRSKLNLSDNTQSLLDEYIERGSQIKDFVALGENYETLVKNIQLTEAEINELTIELANLLNQIKALDPIINKKKGELIAKENEIALHQKKMDLSELRLALVSNEPCPLCGSCEHPFNMHNVVFEEGKLSIELRILKDEIDEANKQLLTKSNQSAARTSKMNEKQNSVQKDKIKLNNLLQDAKVKKIRINDIKVDDLKEEALLIIDKINTFKELLKDENSLATYKVMKEDYLELDKIYTKYKDLKAELKALYPGDDLINVTNDLQDKFNQAILNISKNEESIERLNIYIKEGLEYLKVKELTLISKLLNIGVDSIDIAEKLILSTEEYEKLESKRTELNKIKIELETSLSQLRNSQLLLNEKIKGEKTLEVLEFELHAAQNQRNEKQQSIGKIQEQLKVNGDNIVLRDKKQDAISDQKLMLDKWAILNGLIGDSTGNKFANYAQDLTLKTLISIANKHLTSLSDRYQLVSTSITDDLAIYDTYQGDTVRSISTLSGGETFIVSLAMAVSLSELASRNVMIESIFIDEGFGTLDAESLEHAMTTLEILQANSNKTIGIISHVDSLKERLSTQIQLSKDNKGYSSIKIVG